MVSSFPVAFSQAPWAIPTRDNCVSSFGTNGHLPLRKLCVKSHLELEGMTNTRETEAVLETVVLLTVLLHTGILL